MVSVSIESPVQSEARLRRVIAASELVWEPGEFAYVEYPVNGFPVHEAGAALAFVRDREKWSVLKPVARDETGERFALFSLHFADALDNSGFVGWLAGIIKRKFGSGVIVVCGRNTDRGGIFDYWGIPVALRDDVVRLLEQLQRGGALLPGAMRPQGQS